MSEQPRWRRVALVLGDQLWEGNPALADLDPVQDGVLLIEAPGEAQRVWSHRARTALFLSAMRHFSARIAGRWPVRHVRIDDPSMADAPDLLQRLERCLAQHQAQTLVLCEPGEWHIEQALPALCARLGVALQQRADTHFVVSRAVFARWAEGRKEWRMEHFYRLQRKQHQVLMDGTEPVGGQWNYDADNRKAYPAAGPGWIPEPARFEPDAITREAMADVARLFPDHPGSLEHFAWPVTPEQADEALQRFIDERLLGFGAYQDAMWQDTPFGWHSLLSVALNVHLIDPMTVVRRVEAAWRARGSEQLPLASVEGFVRQVLGWREFIRGVYWHDMPGLKQANHFGFDRPLPRWYWSGDTHMACQRDAIGQTLRHGYAHHIQRLMVTGQFALLAGLSPQAVADWYLAVYVDAVEWVELPNVAGMALYANGGRFTSKPYVASGQYIARMSNHCKGCRYRPDRATGDDACPMTTLYWAFLDQFEAQWAAHPRTALMVNNLQRLSAEQRGAIRAQAEHTLARLDHL